MQYGRNFGVRRMEDPLVTREGRLRTPNGAGQVNGYYLQGSLVKQDPANPGFMMLAGANAPISPGTVGLLISEDAWLRSIWEFDRAAMTTTDLCFVKANTPAQLVTGPGTKVWFRNTPAETVGGRAVPAITMMGSMASVAIDSLLTWDGAKYVITTTAAYAVAKVTAFDISDSTRQYVEAVLLA